MSETNVIKAFLYTVGVFICSLANGQYNNFEWAKEFGVGDLNAFVFQMENAHDGGVYVSGSFMGDVSFDNLSPGLLTSAIGDLDVYLAKLNEDGQLEWVYNDGIIGVDYRVRSIAVMPDNSVLLAYTDNLAGTVLRMLSSSGVEMWSRFYDPDIVIHDMVVNSSGEITCVGDFDGNHEFDIGSGQVVSSGSGGNGFILKLTENGDFVDVSVVWGSQGSELNYVQQRDDGSLICSGIYRGRLYVHFDDSTVVDTSYSGAMDPFIVEYDTGMNYQWHVSGYNPYQNYPMIITLADNGELFSGSNFEGTMRLTGVDTTIAVSSLGQNDISVSRISEFGELEWSNRIGGVGEDFITSMDTYQDELMYTCLYSEEFFLTAGINSGMTPFVDYRESVIISSDFDNEVGWFHFLTGTEQDQIMPVRYSSQGDLLGGGQMKYDMTIGLSNSSVTLNSPNGRSGFVFKSLREPTSGEADLENNEVDILCVGDEIRIVQPHFRGCNVRIFDLGGRLLIDKHSSERNISLEFDRAGFFIVEYVSSDKVITSRIFKL